MPFTNNRGANLRRGIGQLRHAVTVSSKSNGLPTTEVAIGKYGSHFNLQYSGTEKMKSLKYIRKRQGRCCELAAKVMWAEPGAEPLCGRPVVGETANGPRRPGCRIQIRKKIMITNEVCRTILLSALAALTITTGTALACAPAPSCWMKSGPVYLRSVCLNYAKDHQTLKQIAMYMEEPEKIAAFGKACEKLQIHLNAE